MANVGTAAAGKTLIGAGNGASPTYADIGTNSGLTARGVVIAEGNGAFQATATGSTGQVLQSGGAGANPSYSTATYPSTTTINQILYSSSANTVSGLTAANSATLVSTSAGVPVWSSTMTNGQLIIGSTGATPTAASLTAGTGITITPGAGSITIAVSGSAVGQTITGDTGGALSPTAGNWNIVSTATNGIETTGAGSTLTVAMATPYADGDFEFRSAVSGATRTLSVTNTSNTASSQATFLTSVAGTTAGDAWHQWNIGSTRSFSLGVDNSDTNDSLKFTTDADGTVDPSSGTFLGAINPATGGFEWGPNSNGTTTSPQTFMSFRKDQNEVSQIEVANDTDAANATGKFIVRASTASGSIRAHPPTHSTYPSRIQFGGDSGSDGIDLFVDKVGANIRTLTSGASVASNCTDAGEWTFPRQPCFLAYNSVSDTNQTGAGATVTVDFNTEIFDLGADFSADTFTAPVSGRYYFCSHVYFSSISSMETFAIDLVTSNRSYRFETSNNIDQNRSLSISTYADMDPADTAIIQVTISGGAGNTATITGQASTTFYMTTFSGSLVA